MKGLQKIKILTIVFFTSSISLFACDVCSCGASNGSAFSGNFNGHYIGLSYNYLHFNFKEGIAENSPLANDQINLVSLQGQYKLNNKIQLNTIVPYRFNNRETTTDKASNNGIGDVSVYGLYNFFDNQSNHRLKMGAGLKLPTGTFDLQIANSTNQTSAIQLGTGSLDIMLPLQYSFHHKDIVFNVNAIYFIKNKNDDDFKYGNQTQINSQISYQWELNKKTVLVPKVGVSYDHFLATERFNIKDNSTSGYMLNTNFSLETYVSDYVVGVSYQNPITQNLIEGDVAFEKSIGVYTYYRF